LAGANPLPGTVAGMIHDEWVEQVLSLIANDKRGRSSLSAFSGEKLQ
jgi:hypothetical protein